MTNDVNKLTYVFDIDGTLCTNSDGNYDLALPLIDRIEYVNSLYDLGHTIFIQTARGMGRSNNSQIYAERFMFRMTEKQLKKWGIKYHKLFMGKPSGDLYIDDKGEKDENFFNTRN